MANRTDFRMATPQQVYDAYKEIRNSDLILNNTLNETNIANFQSSLNKAQPNTEEESKSRSLIQYLYRKNPTNFCRFLVRSRLSHLILWTEAKCIVRHFGLRGIVYVKWNDSEYECSAHKSVNNDFDAGNYEHPSIQTTYQAIEQYNGGRYNRESGGRGRYNRESGGRGRYNRESGGRGRYNRESAGVGQRNISDHIKPVFPFNIEDNFPTLPVTEVLVNKESVDVDGLSESKESIKCISKLSYINALQVKDDENISPETKSSVEK